MATPVTGRKRQPQRERLTAEDDALSQIAREAEARLAAKRAARAEAREIRMKELERQQKEKYYGLDTKWGDIEQWMEDNECCSHTSQRNALPSEYSCYHGSGSRASSRASSARASPVVEEKSEQDFTEKDLLAEAEEKYKKAMVSNAQLDNEKTNFMYQVDTLKDVLLELEEQLAESRRQYEEKSKEMERQKYAHSVLQFQFNKVKEVLQQREEMLMEIRQLQQEKESYGRVISNLQETIEWKDKKIGEHGIILNSEIATNGETSDKNEGHLEPSVKVNSETSPALKTGAVHPDMRLNHEAQRESFLEQLKDDSTGKANDLQPTDEGMNSRPNKRSIKPLKGQQEEKKKNGNMENTVCEDEVLENGTDIHLMDLQRDANRQISDLKFKLAKSEQQISALEQNIIRLEGQATRYKCATENSEKVEDELKAEKRKLQRELRSALDKIEELEVGNNHLSKRLEKMKTNRSALLSQQ